jgi:hypothetical protein
VVSLVINDTVTTVSSFTDTASLHWTLRANQKAPPNVQIFYYYAIAPNLLTNDNVTFTLSKSVGSDCLGFGVSGANTNVPFDQSPSLPGQNSAAGTNTISVTYNTLNPNDLLIILQGQCAEGSAGAGPTGFVFTTGVFPTGVAHTSNCLSNYLQGKAWYQVVSAVQPSTTINWIYNTQNSYAAVIADAIQSAPGPLSASIAAASNVVDVGQMASFSCTSSGGVSPYISSWTFGDGSTGSGASTDHIYTTTGTVTVVCTVTDALGTMTTASAELTVVTDPTILTFSASPASILLGDKVTLSVSTSGGYGVLSYSYTNLPPGCLSTNSSSLSCYPTSSGNYRATVTITDRTMESANATAIITVGPQRVLGLPQAMGLAIIFAAIIGTSAAIVLSIALTVRRKRGRQAPATA